MPARLVAVADGRGQRLATRTPTDVTVWSGPTDPQYQFRVDFAESSVPVPSRRLAIVDDDTDVSVAVGSWTQGVAAYGLDGTLRTRRLAVVRGQRREVGVGGAARGLGWHPSFPAGPGTTQRNAARVVSPGRGCFARWAVGGGPSRFLRADTDSDRVLPESCRAVLLLCSAHSYATRDQLVRMVEIRSMI